MERVQRYLLQSLLEVPRLFNVPLRKSYHELSQSYQFVVSIVIALNVKVWTTYMLFQHP